MNRKIAIYPGTFDPFTNGHLDLVMRGLRIFDEVIVAVAQNTKKKPLFRIEERIKMIKESVGKLKRVKVESFDGLLVEYVNTNNGIAIIRGLRAVSDFEYELQMALLNRRMASGIEAVFMMPNIEFSFLTSSIIKEIASFGGPVKGLVPLAVEKALKKKFKR